MANGKNKKAIRRKSLSASAGDRIYERFSEGVAKLLETARRTSARAVNVIMTAVYWEIGRRIVEFGQRGKKRAGYGEELLERLSAYLSKRFVRGFSADNLETMRLFYLAYPQTKISETMSRKLTLRKSETSSRIFELQSISESFPLTWSHYVLLVRRT